MTCSAKKNGSGVKSRWRLFFWRGWKRELCGVGIILVVAYVGTMVILTAWQSKLMYHPRREIKETPADVGLAYEDVWLTTADGVKIHGWYVPCEQPRGTVLFFHGNGGNISRRVESLHIFNSLAMNSLIIDYHGYGRSQGKAGEEQTYLDADAAWDFLINRKHISPDRIVMFGRSMGGAIAVNLALKHTPAGVIVESSFTSAPDMAAHVLPVFPVRWMCRFRYNSIDRIGDVKCPVLVIHSPDDNLVPFEMGKKLYVAANEPKQFLQIKGSHNEGFLMSLGIYTAAMEKFLNSCLE